MTVNLFAHPEYSQNQAIGHVKNILSKKIEQIFYFMMLAATETKHSNQSFWTNVGKRFSILLSLLRCVEK